LLDIERDLDRLVAKTCAGTQASAARAIPAALSRAACASIGFGSLAEPHMLPVPPKSSEMRAMMLLFPGDPDHFRCAGKSDEFAQFSYDFYGIHRNSPANRYEFDDVDPPRAALVFSYE